MKKIFLVLTVSIVAVLVALSAMSVTTLSYNADDRKIEKITFIHYRNPHAPAKPTAGTSCYTFLSKGAKWKVAEPYYVNPANNDGLSQNFVFSSVNSGVTEWEKYGGNIFSNGYISNNATYIDDAMDGTNTVSFGYYPNSGVIAVTTVWGYWSGPPQNREILEWDMLFNDYYYPFGDATSNPSVMDLQNIATHELGHSAGMGDLYSVSCYEQTMYGYSDYGETYKRDLASGDITGIKKLYGV